MKVGMLCEIFLHNTLEEHYGIIKEIEMRITNNSRQLKMEKKVYKVLSINDRLWEFYADEVKLLWNESNILKLLYF